MINAKHYQSAKKVKQKALKDQHGLNIRIYSRFGGAMTFVCLLFDFICHVGDVRLIMGFGHMYRTLV